MHVGLSIIWWKAKIYPSQTEFWFLIYFGLVFRRLKGKPNIVQLIRFGTKPNWPDQITDYDENLTYLLRWPPSSPSPPFSPSAFTSLLSTRFTTSSPLYSIRGLSLAYRCLLPIILRHLQCRRLLPFPVTPSLTFSSVTFWSTGLHSSSPPHIFNHHCTSTSLPPLPTFNQAFTKHPPPFHGPPDVAVLSQIVVLVAHSSLDWSVSKNFELFVAILCWILF